ncbi:ParA family protein [Paludisphaera mucosa]|uniref:ParA family protein n=1 Tax=Paludisphaera mucosa TaxID=3030827 RepID=A0ABT6FLK9_9BACT|nr:ParA family protein [Paludisphaera mucosa]
MLVVTLLNQKGGVGKTTCTHHLSGALAGPLGRRVLVVDADPQASLSQGWFGPAGTRAMPPEETIAEIFAGRLPYPDQVIRPTPLAGVSILPGSRAAAEWNDSRPLLLPRESRESLRDFLAQVEDDFDIVLVDPPPNLYGASFAALAASDALLVPLQPEDYGAQGIADVLDSLDAVRGEGYPVELLGYLLTMVAPARALHREYEASLRAAYGEQVFAARLPMRPEFPEAVAHRKTVHQYKPKSAAAKAVLAVAEELLARAAGTSPIAEGVAA